MTDDLVKRLREYRVGCGLHCSAYDARAPLDECSEAADRIEKLEAALQELLSLGEWGLNDLARTVAREALEGKEGA
jgi:hypothetical protein